jgi:hypothetical protein
VKDKRTQDEEKEEEPLTRGFIPYIKKHCSEKIARELRRHNVEVTYMPTTKIMSMARTRYLMKTKQ